MKQWVEQVILQIDTAFNECIIIINITIISKVLLCSELQDCFVSSLHLPV
jgi:hypothetical protein